jgi:hypothetical protein
LGQIDEKDFKFENWQYILEWKNSRKYNKIFFDELLKYKLKMFLFVKEYYKYFMKWREQFPEFDISVPLKEEEN